MNTTNSSTFPFQSIPSSPIQAPKNIIPLHQQQLAQQQAISSPHVQTQSQLHHQQSRPIIYTTTTLNNNRQQSQQQQQKQLNYLSQSPQLSGIIYTSRHPTPKPYMQKIQPQASPVSQQSIQLSNFNGLQVRC